MSSEILLVLAFAEAIATVSGYSVKNIVKRIGRKEQRLLNLSMIRLLSIFDKVDDPLTGLWDLNSWKFKAEDNTNQYVNGNLAILYSAPDTGHWKGILSLRYMRKPSDKGWWARKRGYIIEGAYNVEICKENENSYAGTSTMVYRNPDAEFRNTSEFSNMRIIGNKILCRFENTSNFGEADAIFHQRKRWNEIEI